MEIAIEELDNLIKLIDISSTEKQKRILLGAVWNICGFGGAARINRLTGISYATLRRGKEESFAALESDFECIREPGAGRISIKEQMPEICSYIEQLIDGYTYGDPEKEIHWVPASMSVRKIADKLSSEYGVNVSHMTVKRLLEQMGYSKQVNQKMLQVGRPSPDRNEQFEFINKNAHDRLETGEPVISVDMKKKELVGNFKNAGQEYRKAKDARQVLDHDFPIQELGKVNPYGIYLLNDNTGFINLGTDHDTAEFAATSIDLWWESVGKNTFPNAKRLYITCDGGGSNGSRNRAWKCELQRLADKNNLEIMVSHYPPGTSKWNKIEHRMFCYISKNWQGKPLINIETIVSLIASTTTSTGLKINCNVDYNKYNTGRKITDEELSAVNIFPCERFGNWNYVIKPKL